MGDHPGDYGNGAYGSGGHLSVRINHRYPRCIVDVVASTILLKSTTKAAAKAEVAVQFIKPTEHSRLNRLTNFKRGKKVLRPGSLLLVFESMEYPLHDVF